MAHRARHARPAPAPQRRRRRRPRQRQRRRSARWRRRTWRSRGPKPPFDLTGVWLHGGGAGQLVPLLAAARLQAHAGGAGALRRGAEGTGRRQGLPRRHRPVLAGGAAGDHDARLADRDDAVPDGDLHGQRVHEQPAHHLHGRPAALRPGRRRAAASTASRSAAGKATRWWSTRSTSSATTTGSTPAFPPATPCTSSSGSPDRTTARRCEIEYAMTDPKSWEGEWKMHQAVAPGRRPRHRRGVVPAGSERSHAEHAIEGQRPLTLEDVMTRSARRCARARCVARRLLARSWPITRRPASIARNR